MKKFEIIDHTADVGLRVYGESLPLLFENAARGFFSLLLEFKPQPAISEVVMVEADDLEELLVTWLNELNSLFFSYNFLPASYDITIRQEKGKKLLRAEVKGDNFDLRQHQINMEIKAATYHNLEIKKSSDGYVAEVIFDV